MLQCKISCGTRVARNLPQVLIWSSEEFEFDGKTEFLIITLPWADFSEDIQLRGGQENIHSSSACKSLGVMFDKHFSMESHIKQICKATHFHLPNIGAIRCLLADNAAAQLIRFLITSRLDCCNAILYALPDSRIAPQQCVQNIVARIVTRSQTLSIITSILKPLHWLLIKPRVMFIIFLISYHAIHNFTPVYLLALTELDIKVRELRSRQQHRPKLQVSRLVSYGD